MRIAVLDIAASKTGALSILKDFYDYVLNNPDGNEWIFITGVEGVLKDVPEKKISVICREDVKASSKNRLKFDLFTGAGFIKSLNADVLFSLQNTLPKGIGGIRKVLYVHQPLGYQKTKRFSLFKKDERHLAIYQYLYSPLVNSSVRTSDVTIVQTEWMKRAVIEKTKKKEVIKITPEVADMPAGYYEEEFDKTSFFYPAGDILYKNHAVIERAAALLKKEGINDFSVTFTNKVPLSRDEVYKMYFKSTLIFASYIETFGLPLAECMQTGNPILAADTEFAREILSGYKQAYFFDPFDEKELKELMKKVLEGRIIPGDGLMRAGRDNSYEGIVKLIRGQE